MKFFPRTLLWRTFLLVAVLMSLSVMAWFAIFNNYEREPRAHQFAQMLSSVANLTRAALISARPDARLELLRELSDSESIHIYPVEADDEVAPLPDRPVLKRVQTLLREQLDPRTQLTLELNGEHGLFVSFRIDESDDGDYWLALPLERIDRFVPIEWIGWAVAVLILSLGGAWLIVARIGRPLRNLAAAASEIGQGITPQHVPERGPTEIVTLTRAFNQMSADLSRLDQDRALILAGISHDLRTPLTRLRMGIEMSGMDETTSIGMVTDIEEMDRTIGQFLDFARSEGGEPIQETELVALLAEIAELYRRRGAEMTLDTPPLAAVAIRPQAIRRAVGNLVENALHHAGKEMPIDLSLHRVGNTINISVADRGPGIPAAETERLKRPFTRLEVARTDASGAGLGLAIVDRIARSHGGELELGQRDGGGLVGTIKIAV